jgi:DNA-binding response OmpR family regulator
VLLLLDVPALAAPMLDGGMIPGVRRRRPITRPLRALAPRVLVVDDSISIRRSLETALDRAGFEVQLARDGIEALEMMLVSPPRVVVLDIEMPRLDGFELLSILRGSRQFQGVRVAMLTSRATDKHRAHALSLGAEAYLVKPCPNETLIKTVRQLIEEPSSIV